MKYKIPIPKLMHDENAKKILSKQMCSSCAYHRPLTDDEIEAERVARVSRGGAHYCHERANHICRGSYELQKKL